jgi:hypothetical protein
VECAGSEFREEAEMPDANKAVGDDMLEEPANELVGGQGHDLRAVAVGVVLPAEAHDPVLEVTEGADNAIQPREIQFQHSAVEKQQCAQGLVLGGSCDLRSDREGGEEAG